MKAVLTQGYYKVVATCKYVPYEKIRKLIGPIHSEPTRRSIEIDRNRHIIDFYGQYINHSFDPTCFIEDCHIIALKEINAGDEITFNYEMNETNICEPFVDKHSGIVVKGRIRS